MESFHVCTAVGMSAALSLMNAMISRVERVEKLRYHTRDVERNGN